MKNIFKIKNLRLALLFLITTIFSGCGEMLDDPTIDKDTGEDVNFLIVDFNFFTTRVSYKFIDLADNSLIKSDARIWFTGKNAQNIVNFAGENHIEYSTSEGQLELTLNPYIDFSADNPFEYAINVEIDGYETGFQGIRINSQGKKTFEIYLAKKTQGEEETLTGTEEGDSFIFGLAQADTKSAEANDSHKVTYSILKADLIKMKDFYGQDMFSSVEEAIAAYNSDPANFLKMVITKNTGYPASISTLKDNGENKSVAFRKLETGRLQQIVIAGKKVVDLNGGKINSTCTFLDTPNPDVFGFAHTNIDAWEVTGTSASYDALHFSYTVASASLDLLSVEGARIKFSSNAQSSFSIDADIYDSNNIHIKTINFKGSFPETFILENVPEVAGKIVFRDNNPSFGSIPELLIDNLGSGIYEVDVDPAAGYEEYKVALKALCADNPTLAIAPTYSGEIKIKDSNDAWQGIDMEGGIVDLLCKPNQEYEIRLLWDDQWESTSFSTNFDANGNYLGHTDAKVSSEKLEDGRTNIKIEHTFEQDICDDLGW